MKKKGLVSSALAIILALGMHGFICAAQVTDLTVSDIKFSSKKPRETEDIKIIAKIDNQGRTVPPVNVYFYLDNLSTKIGNDTIGWEIGGQNGGIYEVERSASSSGVSDLNEDLYLTDAGYILFGPQEITLKGNNANGGQNYDDGCVKVEIESWNHVNEAKIIKDFNSVPNKIHIYAQVKSKRWKYGGDFKAKVTITGKKIGGTDEASVTWKAQPEGTHTIWVYVDPENQVQEFDDTNNKESAIIRIKPNRPPHTPTLSGSVLGAISRTYTFTASSSDPENQKIKFVFDWGDGVIHETGYLDYSGQNVIGTLQHSWVYANTYNVKVKAVDEGGGESGWSDPLIIRILENGWEPKVIYQDRYLNNPTLGADKEQTLYLAYSHYYLQETSTWMDLLKSLDEGESFGFENSPCGLLGNYQIKAELTANLREDTHYQHMVFEKNDTGDVFYGFNVRSPSEIGGGIDELDVAYSGGTQNNTYKCRRPDIVSYDGIIGWSSISGEFIYADWLAAVWTRNGTYYNEINEDYLTVGLSFNHGEYWVEPKQITSSGGKFVNPSIAVNANGDLFITSSLITGWHTSESTSPQQWDDYVVGINCYIIPKEFNNWDTSNTIGSSIFSNLIKIGHPSNSPVAYSDISYPQICSDKNDRIHVVFEYPDPVNENDLANKDAYKVYHYKGTAHNNSLGFIDSIAWEPATDEGFFAYGKWPDIAADSVGNAHIVWVKNDDVYYYSPEGGEFLISTGRKKVKNSKPRIAVTTEYIHVTWSEQEDNNENSIYYSRLKFRQFDITQVHCTPNSEFAIAILDVPEYDQNIGPDQDILPDNLWVSFKLHNDVYSQHNITVEIFTEDGITLVRRLVVNQPESLDIDTSGGYSRHFDNFAMWDGQSDIPFLDEYGMPTNGYVPPGLMWKIKITAQEIDGNGNPGKTTTNWIDWNGWYPGYKIIPKQYLAMDDSGNQKGLRAEYSDGTYIYGEGPIDHGPHDPGPTALCYYQGLPGLWAGNWDIWGIFNETLTGYIYAPKTGVYKFMLSSDDYGKLEVNNQIIGIVDTYPGGTAEGEVTLEGDKWYPIKIEYANRAGSNWLSLWWNLWDNRNFIFTDPTFIQAPQKDIKAFQEFFEENIISDNKKKDKTL